MSKARTRSKRPHIYVAVHLVLERIENNKALVLLLKRANTGYQDGKWSLPAGHLDGNETLIAAAIREGREEIGLLLKERDLEFTHVMHRMSHVERCDFFVIVNKWEGEVVNTEPEKCSELGWFSLDKLPEETIPYIAASLRHIGASTPFSVFGWPDGDHITPTKKRKSPR